MNVRNQDWRVLWIWNGSDTSGGPAADHRSLPDSVAPISGGGRIFVGDANGTVYGLHAGTGAELWSRAIGGSIVNAGAYDAATQAVYMANTSGRVVKLRAATGEQLSSFEAGSRIEGAVLLVGNRVIVGTEAGELIALNTSTLTPVWRYQAGAALYGSSGFSAAQGGLVIILAEDESVHAVRISNGQRAWRTPTNAYLRPDRGPRPERRFPDTYPVIAEQSGVVIVRSYFNWSLTWEPAAGAPEDQNAIRQFIRDRPATESFFVLELATGTRRFIAPVLGGAMGNGDYYYSAPPQAVVRQLPDGSEVAYLLWRNRTACVIGGSECDGREDTTFGEMDLTTGAIRFIQDYKNQGTIRFPTDEQGALTLVGDVLFHSHWMSLGAIRIPDRSVGGASYRNPIPSEEYLSVSNTMAANQCPQRNAAERFCPVGHSPPADGYQLDPGFYIYAHTVNVYDEYWHPPVRGPLFDNGVLYWRSSDGAIIALAPVGTPPPTPEPPSGSPDPTHTPTRAATATPTGVGMATATPTVTRVNTATPTSAPQRDRHPLFLPVVS
jgi:outer membrane protein assembly factor BamB